MNEPAHNGGFKIEENQTRLSANIFKVMRESYVESIT